MAARCKIHQDWELLYGIGATLFTIGLWFMSTMLPGVSDYFIIFLFVVSLIVSSKNFIHSFHHGCLNIHLLMLIAAVGAAFLGDWHEGSILLGLFILGEALEEHTMAQARSAINEISKVRQFVVEVIRNGNWVKIDANLLVVGDIIRVIAGQTIPIDGVIVNGESELDMAILTGESASIVVNTDSLVFSGARNLVGLLEIKVTKLASESTMARIVRLVKEAEANKPHYQTIINRFAKYWVPIVLVLAVGVVGVMILLNYDLYTSIYRALTLLVAASPCALIIGTPACYAAAASNAAQHGVLCKGGRYFELLAGIDWMAFDKTGTITEGKPTVVKVKLGHDYPENIMNIVHGLASQSSHPLAVAISKFGNENNAQAVAINNQSEVAGHGIVGQYQDIKVSIGRGLVKSEDKVLNHAATEHQSRGSSVVWIGYEDKTVGFVVLRDEIRDGARGLVEFYNSQGVNCALLSGDIYLAVQQLVAKMPFALVKSEMLPEDKFKVIKNWQENSQVVAMIGDGVNDAAALKSADVGVAMGALGADIALESSDIMIMNNNITSLEYVYKLSGKTLSLVKQNIALALLVAVGLVICILLGHVNMGWAVVLHEGSSVVVALNALRLLR